MLPLAYRLPNPPARFVGRRAELETLARLLESGPLTVVHGVGGIGKTSLVAQALHRDVPQLGARCLMVTARAGGDVQAVAVDVVRAIAAAEGVDLRDWQEHLSEPQLALAAAIDHADAGGYTVVVDECQRVAPDAGAVLAARVASYARAARWVLVGRVAPPRGLLAGRELVVGPMDDASLDDLAGSLAPDVTQETRAGAVREAGGAPWRLRQLLFGAGVDPRDPLEGSSDAARAALETLALLQRPLTPERAGAIPSLSPEAIAELRRHGHVEPRGPLVVHALSRTLAHEMLPDSRRRELAAALIEPLLELGDPDARLEALRLAHELGRTAEVARRTVPPLLRDGYAPEVWQIAGRALPADVALRTAVEAGESAAAIELVGGDVDGRAALARVKALYVTNRFDETVAAGRALVDAGGQQAAQAALFAARALLVLGRADEAEAVLSAPAPSDDPVTRWLVDDMRANAIQALGREDEARAAAVALVERAEGLPPGDRGRVGHYMVRLLYQLGMLREADRVLQTTLEELGPRALSLHVGRKALFSQTVVQMERGRLAKARESAARLLGYFEPTAHLWRAMVELLSGTIRFLIDGAGIDALEELVRPERGGDSPAVVATVRALQIQAAIDAGRPELPWSREDLPTQGPHSLMAWLRYDLHAARWGRETRHAADPGARGEVRFLARSVRAIEQVLSGDAAGGAESARAATLAVHEEGYGPLAADGWAQVALSEAVAGRRDGVERAARELTGLAAAMGSARSASLAESLDAWLAPDGPAWGSLLALAREASPGGRLAAGLLGLTASLDLLERAAVEGLKAMVPATAARLGDADGPVWLIDRAARRVVYADGTVVELDHAAQLWRVLEVLAESGGEATKEELLLGAWDLGEYHPLRHDNRLRVAVRKLRGLVEPGEEPSLVLTTDDGYRLGGAAVWVQNAA